MTDPGAEMKARATQFWREWENKDAVCSYAAAFAAKEVARAIAPYVENERVSDCADCGRSIWFREDRITNDKGGWCHTTCRMVARAVEEERAECARVICYACEDPKIYGAVRSRMRNSWRHTNVPCAASAIHERSQVKGEGL